MPCLTRRWLPLESPRAATAFAGAAAAATQAVANAAPADVSGRGFMGLPDGDVHGGGGGRALKQVARLCGREPGLGGREPGLGGREPHVIEGAPAGPGTGAAPPPHVIEGAEVIAPAAGGGHVIEATFAGGDDATPIGHTSPIGHNPPLAASIGHNPPIGHLPPGGEPPQVTAASLRAPDSAAASPSPAAAAVAPAPTAAHGHHVSARSAHRPPIGHNPPLVVEP